MNSADSKNNTASKNSDEKINSPGCVGFACSCGDSFAVTNASQDLLHIINSIPSGVVVCDPRKPDSLIFSNKTVCKMTGYSEEELMSSEFGGISSLVPQEERYKFKQFVTDSLTENHREEHSCRFLKKNGDFLWVKISGHIYKTSCDRHLFVAVIINVTEEKKARDFLAYKAEHDSLTGIYNKEHFYKKTSEILASRKEEKFALVRCNIERFKFINDLFGIETGDVVLKELASRLIGIFHKIGTYGRLDADNFAACIPVSRLDSDKLYIEIQKCFESLNIEYEIPIKIGIFIIDDITIPVSQMCDRAAMALQSIKGNYMKCISYYDEAMRQAVLDEQSLTHDMERALADREFVIYLQPVYSVTEEAPIGAEALVRWQHPTKGFLSPDKFIPVFEKNRFIIKLDSYVREEVCRYLAERKLAGKTIVPISVNVSRLNIYMSNFCSQLVELLDKYELDHKYMKIEITESSYTDTPKRIVNLISCLHSNGFAVLMDDFGSGYSSLNMLKDIDVDILKIDRNFINGIESSERGSSVLGSIVRLAKWLNIPVVAEGVENAAQLDYLTGLGCDCIQGYYFSPPVPMEKFNEIIDTMSLSGMGKVSKVTLDEIDFERTWKSSRTADLIMNSMVGAMGIYELSGGRLELLRVNDDYYKLTGTTPEDFNSMAKDIMPLIHEDDRYPLLAACDAATASHKVETLNIRRKQQEPDEEYRWLALKVRHIGDMSDRSVFYFALDDLSAQKRLEHEESLKQLTDILRLSYIGIIHFNYSDDTATVLYSAKDISIYAPILPLDETYENFCSKVSYADEKEVREFLKKENVLSSLYDDEKGSISTKCRLKVGAKYIWSQISIFRIKNTMGKKTCMFCLRDIDDEFRLEKSEADNRILKLKYEDEQRYRAIVESTGTYVFEWDLDNEIFSADAGCRKFIVDEKPDTSLPYPSVFSVHPDDRAEWGTLRNKFNIRGRKSSVEVRLQKKDLSYSWCRVSTSFISGAGGKNMMVGTVTVIDDKKNTELDLQSQINENKRQLEHINNIYDSLPCGVAHFTADEAMKYIESSKSVAEILGYNDTDDIHRAVSGSFLNLAHPEDAEEFKKTLKHCIDKGERADFGCRFVKKDGNSIFIAGRCEIAISMTGGRVIQIFFIDTSKFGVYVGGAISADSR